MAFEREIFDGKQLVEGVPFERVQGYYSKYIKSLNLAIRGWNQLSKQEAQSAEAAGIRERLREAIAWGKAIQPGYAQAEARHRAAQSQQQQERQVASAGQAAKAAHQAQCKAFMQEAITPTACRWSA